MSDQMPLHRNESSGEKTLNFKGSSQTTYVKENHSLSRERTTVMTSLSSEKVSTAPKLEFVFKGVGTRVKLDPPAGVTVQWAPKGSYRVEHMVKFCSQVPVQSCALFPQKRKIFTLDDYSAHLDPQIKEELKKQGYFLVILPGGITGDLQVNDTDLHHPLKTLYREKESALMIDLLTENPGKIPAPNRDQMMRLCQAAFNEALVDVDISGAFKRNGLTIKLDGTEDHLVSNKLKLLVWDKMIEFRERLLRTPHPSSLKKLDEMMIPPDGVKRKLVGVVDGVPPDEGMEVLGGELTDEEYASNSGSESKNEEEEESSVTQVTQKQPPSQTQHKSTVDLSTVDPVLKADLECLNRIESAITAEKSGNKNLLPFLVKMQNIVSGERKRRRQKDKATRNEADTSEQTLESENDNNAFDLFE